MCRLFALHAGDRDVAADFWLLNAPDSIARQSEVNADGYGLAALTARRGMIIMRNPVEAAGDNAYQQVAQRLVAAEMIVHLRYADTGGTSLVNTHPFTQDGRAFAHNGVVGDLDRIEKRLGSNRAMVMGETDSERFFALITLAIRDAGGDVRAGITAAVREVVEEYELYSLNFVIGELGHIWAFRYPENNPLLIFQRQAGGLSGGTELDHSDSTGNLRLRSDDAAHTPLVVISSEQISDEPGWEEIASGELVHVGPDLQPDRETIVSRPPRHPMVLSGRAEKAQSYD
jgi:predicted glutamine amidotransferase